MGKREGYPSIIAVLLQGEEAVAPNAQDIARIDMVISDLTTKEAKAVRMYYGLDGIAKTQHEIGRHLAVTPARVSQILRKAMRKLSHPVRVKVFWWCAVDKRIAVLE
ncbi:hypothetical protein KJ639_00225, partial [Patescibacteria group bacterium]|nr:hypothetical protein [Patescibacteria group bacterium]